MTTTTTTIDDATPDAVFALLADPAKHAAIDGTGWVRQPFDDETLTHVGQLFRMAMYHENHPDKDDEMVNRIEVFDAPHAISWLPGQVSADTGDFESGGWTWRYDLAAVGSATTVTLTYDWSAVPAEVRKEIEFPPFDQDHLDHSLQHLAGLV